MTFQTGDESFARSLRPATTAPPDLNLMRRQQAQSFIGYTFSDSSWISLTCDLSYTFAETKPFGSSLPGYAGCCLGACILPTSCTDNTIYSPFSYSTVCGQGSSCVTGAVASSVGAELVGDLYIFCGNFVQNWQAYRTISAIGSSPSSAGITITTSSQTTSSNANPSSVGITTTSSQASSSINNGHSGAAISGTIVGPICGVALILGLAFLFFRRGRNKPAQFESSSHVQSPPPPGLAHFEGYPGDKPELAATNPLNPRPVSVSPTYRGTVMAASTSIPRKEVPSPTASYDTQHPMSLSGPGQQGVAPYGQQHSQIDEMPATEPPF